jgi:ribosomal protein S18 acetylase RimI-like enzyme
MIESPQDDAELLVQATAAIHEAFHNAGTAAGDAGIAERDARLDAAKAEVESAVLDRLTAGQLRYAVVTVDDQPGAGAVGGGCYAPVGGVAELLGIGVLPAFRRRGLAAAVTHTLAADALARGTTTVFCSAGDDDVARVYAEIGFNRVGTACIAEV